MTRVSDAILARWLRAAAPPPELTVSQWADANRYLPETSSSRGARWRTDTTPYLRGIMDAVHEPGVTKIAVEKCVQSGGSESLHNIIGYFIQHQPCPMLLIHPTMDNAEEWSKDRLNDILKSTPVLGEAINESLSTLTYKAFPGGFLAVGGGNSANSFARRSVRIAIADDADRLPPFVGEEGDPADLLAARVTAWDDGLQIFVSTPTLKGGRIDTLYEHSDQRRYFVTCPNCGREDWITWSDAAHFRVVFDERNSDTARIECPDHRHGGCEFQILEPVRRMMIADGGWRPTREPKERGLVGFHLPAMVSTLGSVTLPQIVEKFLAAHARGRESLRAFMNTVLGEGWEERGTRMQPHILMQRREVYGDGVDIPAAASVVTAGVDVQDNRFQLQVIAWGSSNERWVVDWRTISGDPKRAETQAALLEALSRKYVHALGPSVMIVSTCIDTGYATEEMYDFIEAHQHRNIYATKGFGSRSGEPIVGKVSDKRYGKRPRPVRLWPINTDDAKTDVMAGLTVDTPGPGYIHFPRDLDLVDEEYFAQLCAEHRVAKYNVAGVATHTAWIQHRERNEALDTAVLALAAFLLSKQKVHVALKTIRDEADKMTTVAQPAPVAGTPSMPAAPRPIAPAMADVMTRIRARRAARSRYLG